MIITETERLARQRLSTAVAYETLLVVELLIVLHKLDVPFQDIPADFTLLGEAFVVALVTNKLLLVFSERLAGQWFPTSGANKAFAVVETFVTRHVLDSTLDEVPAGNAALGVVGAVAIFAHLWIDWRD